jgi:hypothetical protein
LDNSEADDKTTELDATQEYDWGLAFQVLNDLLTSNKGCVSTTALRRELENHGIADARPVVVELKFFDPESSRERGIPVPSFKFHHLGRSFYSEERYKQELKKQEEATTKEADAASRQASVAAPEEPPVSRTNRQEEARLVAYVKGALEDLYSSEAIPEDRTIVFDVHSARKGSSFENVDLIAVHWRPCNVCDLITVEVKLEFSAQVVQQALNYARFSHRAWVAVLVETDSNAELREKNPTLFEYAISHGLGILACRRRQGRSYEVFPVHWPIRNQLDPLEEEEFKERYRNEFEAAGVIEPREKRRLPRLR